MVDKIDTKALCGHLRALLVDKVDTDSLQRFIGHLNNLQGDDFVNVAKDLATVFTQALVGNFKPTKSEIPTLAFHLENGRNRYRLDLIDEIIDMDPGDRYTHHIWAGMTNLKSAAVITRLSRSEKDTSYSNIVHKTLVDENFISEWDDFVPEFWDFLIDRLELEPTDRKYLPIWRIPETEKSTCYIDKNGRIQRAQRGSLEALNPNSLRHPDIYRLALEYPNEFASALWLGYDAEGVSFKLMKPFTNQNIPLLVVCFAPKRAEKVRVVVIPLEPLDSLSRPLFYTLERFYVWNIQGARDHDESRDLVRRLLINNLRKPDNEQELIYSFDQSSFTDNFSYTFVQRKILEHLLKRGFITPFDLKVVDTINYGLIDLSALRKHSYGTYGTGTGMGTPPSFPLGSLANGTLAAMSYWQVHNRFPEPVRKKEPFAQVAGDDTAILGNKVGEQYRLNCSLCGLKINESKSIISNEVAEFCGKFITKRGIFEKKKLKDIPTKASLVHNLQYYKDRYLHYIRNSYPEYEYLAQLLVNIPEPYGANVPVDPEFKIDQLTTLEVYVRLATQLAEIRSYDPEKSRVEKRDYTRFLRKISFLPEITATSKEKHPWNRILTSLTPIEKCLVIEALKTYSVRMPIATVGELLQAARIVDGIYHCLDSLGTFKKTPLSPPFQSTIKKGKKKSAEVELNTLLSAAALQLNTPDSEKEVHDEQPSSPV